MLPVAESVSVYEQALHAEREGKFAEAHALFLACVAGQDTDAGEAYFHSAWCLEQTGEKHDEVVRLYCMASSSASTPLCKMNSLFRAGWVLMQSKDHLQAADLFRQTVEYCAFLGMKTDTYHQAMFWYAVCLEARSWFLDALKWYRCVAALSPALDPESRYRQIMCLNQVGLYEEALGVCTSFEHPSPVGFDPERYTALQSLARREAGILLGCLNSVPKGGADAHAGA